MKEVMILVGGSGSGKNTVMEELCNNYNYEKLVTTTTRKPREGEVNGVDYHFITIEEFSKRNNNNEFLETVKFNENFYGSGLNAFEKDFKKNIPIIILEPSGAKIAKKLLKEINKSAKIIFINESEETCIERVLKRPASTTEKIERIGKIKTQEKNWGVYLPYDFKTTQLSTVKKNANDINKFINKQIIKLKR